MQYGNKGTTLLWTECLQFWANPCANSFAKDAWKLASSVNFHFKILPTTRKGKRINFWLKLANLASWSHSKFSASSHRELRQHSGIGRRLLAKHSYWRVLGWLGPKIFERWVLEFLRVPTRRLVHARRQLFQARRWTQNPQSSIGYNIRSLDFKTQFEETAKRMFASQCS